MNTAKIKIMNALRGPQGYSQRPTGDVEPYLGITAAEYYQFSYKESP